MSTELEVSEAVASSVDSTSEHVSTTLVEYRTYGAYDDKLRIKGAKKTKVKNGDGSVSEVLEVTGNPAVLSQTQTGKNWENAEAAGATVLNRNQFKFYTLTDSKGLETLVPDEKQRLYIIQKGLDAIQTAAANRMQTETEEKKDKENDPDVLAYNDETIDLRDAINKPPEKKNLTDEEKFARAISVVNPDKLADLINQLKARLEQQVAS